MNSNALCRYCYRRDLTKCFRRLHSDSLFSSSLCVSSKARSEESVREPFVETWSENTGGTGAIKLYIREIMTLVALRLENPQWRVKQVAGLALADACETIGVDIREHLPIVCLCY